MKRKMKLFTSIASLTLAVALLVVGVFAAADRAVNINGNVSFTAVNIDAEVEVTVSHGTITAGDNLVLSNESKTAKITYSSSVQPESTTVKLSDHRYEDILETQTYTITVKITNNFAEGGRGINVAHTAVVIDPAIPGLTVSDTNNVEDGTFTGGVLSAGATVTYTIVYTLNPQLAGASIEHDVEPSFVLTRA